MVWWKQQHTCFQLNFEISNLETLRISLETCSVFLAYKLNNCDNLSSHNFNINEMEPLWKSSLNSRNVHLITWLSKYKWSRLTAFNDVLILKKLIFAPEALFNEIFPKSSFLNYCIYNIIFEMLTNISASTKPISIIIVLIVYRDLSGYPVMWK